MEMPTLYEFIEEKLYIVSIYIENRHYAVYKYIYTLYIMFMYIGDALNWIEIETLQYTNFYGEVYIIQIHSI